MGPKVLLGLLGVLLGAFSLAGAWEIGLHILEAPQALVGALGFLVLGLVALAATALGLRADQT